LPFEVESLDAASARLPGGAYTTLRTYQRRKILGLDDHLARLEASARRLAPQARPSLDCAEVKRALGRALDLTGFSDSRLRLTLTAPGGKLYISVQPFAGLPSELFERGVAVVSCPFVQHETQAKSTASIAPLHGAQARLPSWAHEGIMLDDKGRLLEGLSSNFFAVRGGVLRTAGTGVVAGLVRAVVLELAAPVLPMLPEPVRLNKLREVDECFITSASREVLPVARVDDQVIGAGRPGAVTRELLRRFRDHVRACAEPV
jgi:branched-subunit amino acid aminotransferase/4-amino-4-deoxychorismate lyase